jgi:hypothetical protein
MNVRYHSVTKGGSRMLGYRSQEIAVVGETALMGLFNKNYVS